MHKTMIGFTLGVAGVLLGVCAHSAVVTTPPDTAQPNILLIVLDDLGYSDLGFNGSEIRTPHIDGLAASGVFLSNFYASATCSPTRAALMTGVDPHTAGLGTMAAARADERLGSPGFEGYLNDRVMPIAQLLRDAGYHTSIAGKWHLGAADGQRPESKGFDRSFALMGGGASHFADASGLVVFERGADYFEDGVAVDELPADFYSSTFYTNRALDYIGAAQRARKPFFSYVAYTAPHWPLQVPDADLDLYAGVYDEGYEVLLHHRVAAMRRRGLVPLDSGVAPAPAHLQPWAGMNAQERAEHSREMEIYAAMIERVDREIGRLLAALERDGELRNTLVILLSDNGPEGNDIGQLPMNRLWIPLAFDNDLDNIGRVKSYTWTGPGWALASSGPFRLYKTFASEGGIRVPAVVSWPARIPAQRRLDGIASVTDLVATLLDYAGAESPGPEFAPLDGQSLRGYLEGSTQASPRTTYASELFGRHSIRMGAWKALWLYPPFGSGDWQLYNLDEDPGETHDLAVQQPARLKTMVAAWETWRKQQGFTLPSQEIAYGLPAK